jgi:RimJ/RimL family protein N-acetyltransferase
MIGDKTCWDRGYGTDAILTLLRFAFDEMNLHRAGSRC